MLTVTIVGAAALAGVTAMKYLTRKERHIEIADSAWTESNPAYFESLSDEYIETMNTRVQAAREKQAV